MCGGGVAIYTISFPVILGYLFQITLLYSLIFRRVKPFLIVMFTVAFFTYFSEMNGLFEPLHKLQQVALKSLCCHRYGIAVMAIHWLDVIVMLGAF